MTSVCVFGLVTVLILGFEGGLAGSAGGTSFLTEYGPAVAGRAATSGLLLPGRIGAPESPPELAPKADFVGAGTADAVEAEATDAWEVDETFLVVPTGEK